MIKKLCNLYIKHKTKGLTRIPLFTMAFNYPKFNCMLYTLHPDIAKDKFLKEKLCECVDYIRDNYDMEIFTRI